MINGSVFTKDQHKIVFMILYRIYDNVLPSTEKSAKLRYKLNLFVYKNESLLLKLLKQ